MIEGYDLSILPKEFQKSLKTMPAHLWEMGLDDLEAEVRPSPQLNRIRLAFWREYDVASADMRTMELTAISEDLAMPKVVILSEIKDPMRMMFVLRPPSTYDAFLDEALERGGRKLRSLFDLDIVNPTTGERDHKLMDLMLKVYALLDMRKHGGIVQKNMNLNVEMNEKNVRKLARSVDIGEIDAKIKELEQKRTLSFAGSFDGESVVNEVLGGKGESK